MVCIFILPSLPAIVRVEVVTLIVVTVLQRGQYSRDIFNLLIRSDAPVRNLQVLYLFKFFGIIGNERHAERVSMCADQHVHRSDRLPCPLQFRPDCAVFLGRLFIEVRDFEGENELVESLLVFLDGSWIRRSEVRPG